MTMNWRLASRLSVITLAILVVITVALIQRQHAQVPATANMSSSSSSSSGLQGTELDSRIAPNFSLTDQFGKPVSLAQFQGKPVILTFMYTHCPDVCPLTAEKLHSTMQMLGSDAHDIGIIAVSTDPKRDNTAAALNFSQSHNMQDYWHYLVGTQQQLSPVWSSYSILAQTQGDQVNHSMGLYLIDQQGHERLFMDNDFTPSQLAANLKLLLKK
ncbi:SCO family protein [Ktedonosporobacter rubrisoli]|uniref:SCO family protein n=1 Tax=Ktedonosporobacter rubrisoli TaxID=2509675 RepID=A0A4P6K0P1_KTERU|nr:SCO family protein [Ktedonosporobacter rubrisoli]QBD81200.1 SCO family protein [Ktedonosporobacter rubrisoli]